MEFELFKYAQYLVSSSQYIQSLSLVGQPLKQSWGIITWKLIFLSPMLKIIILMEFELKTAFGL